jgi:hypothetical protein
MLTVNVVTPASKHRRPPRRRLIVAPPGEHPRSERAPPSDPLLTCHCISNQTPLPAPPPTPLLRQRTRETNDAKAPLPAPPPPLLHEQARDDTDAKAPSSASMLTCVAPTSEHCPPPRRRHRCRLRQHVRDSRQSRGTVICPATDSPSRQRANIVICPVTDSLSRQRARDGQ